MKFDGDPMNFWVFMNAFDCCVGTSSVGDGVKLNRLLEYCTGKAAKVIRPCALMHPEEGYAKARSLLVERFGNDYQISEAWICKVTEGPTIRPNNGEDIQDLADDLRGCTETLKAMNKLNDIDSRVRMVKIVKRLPLYLQSRWRKEAVDMLRNTGGYPGIEKLVEFLNKVANEINDPVFGMSHDQKKSSHKQEKIQSRGSSFNVHATHGVTETKSTSLAQDTSEVESRNRRCHLCNADHYLALCTQFNKMDPEKRLEFVKEKRLCFNCLKVGKHTARWCRIRNCCGVQGCSSKHSKLLHDALSTSAKEKAAISMQVDKDERVDANSCACGSPESEATKKIALPIVAVRVKVHGQKDSVLTHALLDPGSNKTFCSQKLIDDLGIKGESIHLSLSTLSDGKMCSAQVVALEVTGTRGHRKQLQLPRVYAVEGFPNLISSKATEEDISNWSHLKDIEIPKTDADVTLLIGQDNPQALMPLEVRRGGDYEPYAVRCCLGWIINGPMSAGSKYNGEWSLCNFIHADVRAEDSLQAQVEQFWKVDTAPALANNMLQMSLDDKRVIDIWNSGLTVVKGHYQLDIPFCTNPPELPNNRPMAEKRLKSLGRRLERDTELHKKYKAGMEDLLQKEHIEKVPEDEVNSSPGKIWYLPHHPVINPNKSKIRIVFDCAAEYEGTSLNKRVLQGPDLTNKLLGVLLRFREEPVAVMGDIEGMFHQVRVNPDDRDALRFLWWKDGDMNQPTEIYRMTVHLFGGIWSPSCASFALRRTADDHASEYDPEVIRTVYENFYVDDCLKSVSTVQRAIQLVQQLCQLLRKGGFRLTKWVSNQKEVMESIPETERAKEVEDLNLPLPVERALGLEWKTSTDVIGIKVTPKEGPHTRRGLLAVMSSVYDPLGFVSPFVLLAKKIFQAECRSGKGWDEELDQKNKEKWLKWLEELPMLQEFQVERCMAPSRFSFVQDAQMHHFCDASEEAYGAVSYIRLMNADGEVHCSLLMAKSRLAPVKPMTIPRLELSAAVIAVRMDTTLRNELRISLRESVFWTDSEIVLKYIKNTAGRFHTFVANRVSVIHDGSQPHQWHHVSTKSNPADDASRGLSAAQMVSSERWLKGPQFLHLDMSEWPQDQEISVELPQDDKEVKQKANVCVAEAQGCEALDRLIEKYSCWFRLRRAIAWMLRFKIWLRRHKTGVQPQNGRIQVNEMAEAEKSIATYVQRKYFQQELQALKKERRISRSSLIYSLEPQIDDQDLIRVGGRLENAPLSDEAKHPVVLPRDHHVSKLIVRHMHEWGTGHSGRDYVLSMVRQKYWIPKARPLITRVLKDCILCRRLRGPLGVQRMSALTPDQVTPNRPPFTHVGVDCFGPFYVKRGRAQEKRYGCLFTCLNIRAVHLEKLSSLDSDSFINALMRMAARRGMPEKITSDNGTNFVGGEKELRQAVQRWNEDNRMRKHLLLNNIEWKFNPPAASHMGGVWERQIRTVRKVLSAIVKDQAMDDERLDTLFCEVESIVNGRPITPVSEDPKDPEALTPNHLLLLRGGPAAPPGVFQKHDRYLRRWRHVQLLADHFWRRWVREYLPLLRHRQKWLEPKRNFAEGDIILVMDEATPRRCWPLGKVIKVFPGRDGLVRSAQVQTRWTILTRPVNKLCLLEAVTS